MLQCSDQELVLAASLRSLPCGIFLPSQVGFLHEALISLDSVLQFRRFAA